MTEPTYTEPDWTSKGEPRTDIVIYKDASGKIQSSPSGGGIAGIGTTQYKRYSRVLFANGETWDIPDDGGRSEQVNFDAGMSAAFRATTAAGAKSTAAATAAEARVAAAKVAAEERAAANQRYYDLNTTARYIPKPGAPGTPVLWPEGGVSAAPGAPPDYEENPNYDPKTSALDVAYKQAQIDALNRRPVGADLSAQFANLAWNKERAAQLDAITAARNTQEDALKREAAAAAYKQFQELQAAENARNRLTNTVKASSDLMETWAKATPSAMIPGQQQFLGFEPSGPMEQLVRMGGGRYDPNLYRPAPVQIDPAEAWRQAQGMIRGGGG